MEGEEVGFVVGGTRCAAWLFRPEGPGPAPCVVLGSGLSCVRDQGLDRYSERFAAAGIAALAFDYRFFGDSEGEPRTLLSARMQREDFRAAVAFARTVAGIDHERIAIWGFSYGSAHAQEIAISDPSIAAAVLVSPLIDGIRSLVHMNGLGHFPRLMKAGLRDLGRAARATEPFRIPATGPPESGAALCTRDAIEGFEAVTGPDSRWRNDLCARGVTEPPYRLERKVRRLRCPALYCIAEDDEVNPPELAERTARSVASAELRLYPGGHFEPFLGETFERVVADQVGFLERKL